MSLRQGSTRAVIGAYMREAIRPHVTGRFSDMLLAVMRHPAMLMYLDNASSIGPDSATGRRSHHGLNENLARECLELHTVSPAAGYSQGDVTSFAAILTGWGVDMKAERPGFVFREKAHEPGPKTLMGQTFPEGEEGGVQALHFLGTHPATYHHIATQMVRHFVSDTPSPASVRHVETVLRDSEGDLQAASLALADLPDPGPGGASSARPWTMPRPCSGHYPSVESPAGRTIRILPPISWRRLSAHSGSRCGPHRCPMAGATMPRTDARPRTCWPVRTGHGGWPRMSEAVIRWTSPILPWAPPCVRRPAPPCTTPGRVRMRWPCCFLPRIPEALSHDDPRRTALLGLAASWTLGRSSLAFAGSSGGPDDPRLVVVILRGALDGLSAVTPYGDPDLVTYRRALVLPEPGQEGGLLDLGGFYGLHPSLATLHGLYGEGQMLPIHAVAGHYRSRSHFEAQDYLESGADERLDSGWLNRAVSVLQGKPTGRMATGWPWG